ECIYRHKPDTFEEANHAIAEFIHFYNYERIQIKTGEAPLVRHLSS
ncbi:IS3 family transposase, partial [Lawsonibacter sp. NSJ-52]|nr:IS3 family transposase [Lawsonibacter faecis]MBC5736264.1 IS3 family transposase [Lawsonibacter faecis]MBC5738838.1 IS3 family transposase [Lawsonibacter faecis]